MEEPNTLLCSVGRKYAWDRLGSITDRSAEDRNSKHKCFLLTGIAKRKGLLATENNNEGQFSPGEPEVNAVAFFELLHKANS